MNVGFGVFISPERPSYEAILDDVLHCEALGYHSVWISDHLIGMYRNPGDPRFECLTTKAALAANTSTIRLGQLVLCNPFRQPASSRRWGPRLTPSAVAASYWA